MTTARFSLPKPQDLRILDALRSNDFRLLWFASWMWYHARWIEVTILGWVVLVLTDSPFLVGLIGFFRMIPMPFLGMVAGMIADRANRKHISIIVQLINIVAITVLLALLSFDVVQFWHMALITLSMGTAWTMDFPTRRSVIADLVGTQRVANAMSVDMTAMTGSKMIGPILGGTLLAVANAEVAILFMLVLYLIGFVFLIKVHFPERQATPSREPVLHTLAEGLVYVAHNRVMLGVILVTITANMFLFPFVLMVPVFARDVLHVGPALMGMLAAADGFGSMIGAIYLASRGTINSPGKLFAYGTSVAILLLLAFSFSRIYGVSIALLFVGGLFIAGFGTMQSAITLLVTPAAMRGRAMGVVMMAIGASPVGILLTGAVAEAWGAPAAIAIDCGVALALMTGILIGIPVLRRMALRET